MCLFEKRFSHQHGAQEDCAGVMVEFVNLPRQSAGWRLRFAKFVLSSAALTAFIPKLSNGVWWKKAGKGTICCRITDCAELEGAYTLRRLFSGFGWWFLFPLPHQMDSWIFYPLFLQLSHHASLELSFSLFNFYNFPSPFPDGVSSSLCFTQARNCFGKTLLALSHEELNIALEGNSRFFTFKILWHSVCFSQSSWVKKLVPRMGGSIGIAFDSLLGSA